MQGIDNIWGEVVMVLLIWPMDSRRTSDNFPRQSLRGASSGGPGLFVEFVGVDVSPVSVFVSFIQKTRKRFSFRIFFVFFRAREKIHGPSREIPQIFRILDEYLPNLPDVSHTRRLLGVPSPELARSIRDFRYLKTSEVSQTLRRLRTQCLGVDSMRRILRI